jgi:transposase
MSSSSSPPGRRPDPATRQLWQQRLDRFRKSGLTVPVFCKREGISTASFYTWRRRLYADSTPPAADTTHLVPVRLVTSATDAPVELLLPSGVVLRLTSDADLVWLKQLLGLLGVNPC